MGMFQKMRQNMEGMTPRQKVEYYLEYYGWRTVGFLAVLLVAVFLVVQWVAKKPVVLGVLAVNADGEEIQAEDASFFVDFLSENGLDPKKSDVLVNCSLHVSPNYADSVSMTNMNTIQTLFDTRSMDIFFADEEYFMAVGQFGYLADLQGILPQETLESHAQDLVYVTVEESGQEILAGIRVSADTPWMAGTGWYQSGAVVGLAAAGKHLDLATNLLLLAIGDKT